MSRKPRLGLIGTGQGPRLEYIAFHGELLRDLGVEVDVVMRHALGGLSLDEIKALSPPPESAAIHSYVRSPGETSERFGSDWGEAWMACSRYVPLIQACIDELEKEEGVDVIIWCCAEAFPGDTFRSTKPLVMPYLVGLGYAEAVARSIGDGAVVAVLSHGGRQHRQQLEMWRRQPWAANLKIQFEELGESPLEAVRRLADVRPDLVINWGYGGGLAPGDPPALISEMEAILRQPIIVLHVVTTLFVRNLLCPSINGRDYAERR